MMCVFSQETYDRVRGFNRKELDKTLEAISVLKDLGLIVFNDRTEDWGTLVWVIDGELSKRGIEENWQDNEIMQELWLRFPDPDWYQAFEKCINIKAWQANSRAERFKRCPLLEKYKKEMWDRGIHCPVIALPMAAAQMKKQIERRQRPTRAIFQQKVRVFIDCVSCEEAHENNWSNQCKLALPKQWVSLPYRCYMGDELILEEGYRCANWRPIRELDSDH